LMTASFTTDGVVGLVPALAIMLGANVGTTLIVQLLSFNIAAAAPVLFVIGLTAFRVGGGTHVKDIGRTAIGLGLILLSLHILLDTLAPAEQAPVVKTLLGAITGDPVLCVLIAAALAWAAHSSVAIVLLIMSLAFSGFVTPVASLALVLGANLGSAINPLFEGVRRGDPASYRLPVGNLFNRIIGIVAVLPFLHPIARILSEWQPDASKATASFHVAFNLALALVFIGMLDPLAKLLTKVFPSRQTAIDPNAPRYLDPSALDVPAVALSDAARETLHMGDIIEIMLQQVMKALMTNDRVLVAEVSRMDNAVDQLDEAIKLYVAKLTGNSLDEREAKRAMEIVSFSINLEHVGDIIDKNLSELASKKAKRKLQFSAEGAAELEAFHRRVLESLRMAFGVFMSGDVEDARRLIQEKSAMRNAELATAERHFERLREARSDTIETSSIHLDVLRDLKRIHSHICTAAYPILEAAGEMASANVGESDPITLAAPSPIPPAVK